MFLLSSPALMASDADLSLQKALSTRTRLHPSHLSKMSSHIQLRCYEKLYFPLSGSSPESMSSKFGVIILLPPPVYIAGTSADAKAMHFSLHPITTSVADAALSETETTTPSREFGNLHPPNGHIWRSMMSAVFCGMLPVSFLATSTESAG